MAPGPMTLTLLLIRHAAHVELGRTLTGRRRDVALSDDGLQQAEIVADLLAVEPISAVYSSPRERAWYTAREIADRLEQSVVAAVSHCDIIRGLISFYLGLPLDNLLRFDIDPASVSRLVIGDWGARVMSVNERLYQ
jgi:broad specificity phosphatase PhoE